MRRRRGVIYDEIIGWIWRGGWSDSRIRGGGELRRGDNNNAKGEGPARILRPIGLDGGGDNTSDTGV